MSTDLATARAQSSRHSKHRVASIACNAVHHTSEMFLTRSSCAYVQITGGTYIYGGTRVGGGKRKDETSTPAEVGFTWAPDAGSGECRTPLFRRTYAFIYSSAHLPQPQTLPPLVYHHVSARSHFWCRMRCTLQPALASAQAHRRRQKPATGPSGRVCQTLLPAKGLCCPLG